LAFDRQQHVEQGSRGQATVADQGAVQEERLGANVLRFGLDER
jgi:hypothetical protein